MHIFDNFTGETLTIVKGGALYAVNDKPGDVLALWPHGDKPERLKSWNDRPAAAKRIAAMRAAGFYVETVPSAGKIAAIAFRESSPERARILRRAAIAAVHGMDCTNPA